MSLDLSISGMTCASCVARVEKKFSRAGINAVVNLATESAHIEGDVTLDDAIAIVEKAGYGAKELILDDDAETERSARIADLWRRFLVAAALTVPIVALSMVPAWQFNGWQWLVAAMSLPVAFWSGWPFHKAAAKAARHGSTTMDTLVSLGVLASMGWSFWALIGGGAGKSGYTMAMTGIHGLGHTAHLYFESAAMIVTFLLVGRWLEARSRRSAGDALRDLLHMGADRVAIVREDGSEEVIDVAELRVGQTFRVRPGEKIATDGEVVTGASAVDASLVTGESLPIPVGPGSEVTGGTINADGSLLVRATRVGSETMLAQMGKLLSEAQTGKASVQRLADRISSIFVPTVIAIALITLVVRLAMGNPIGMALASAITVLVVACPCALGLATPTALLVGSGRLSKMGALISGPEVLEAKVDQIILDKTGTLTTGKMTASAPDDVLALAASVEDHSEHPIAKAIVAAARERGLTFTPATDFTNVPGHGVVGNVDGRKVWVGRGANGVEVSVDDVPAGTISVTDTPRPEAAEAMAQLRALGVEPVLVTGDNEAAAREIAAQLGITQVRAGVLPEGKLDEVRARTNVAMVGDGVNDAAALAAADLSIAMGSGTDVAKSAADVTIVNSDLRTVPATIHMSRRTLRIIKENLAWAFGYNIIAIPLAVAGVIVPGIAAAAMASSSVIVVLNSLRLRRDKAIHQ